MKNNRTILIGLLLVSVLVVSGCLSSPNDDDSCQIMKKTKLGNATCEELVSSFDCCYTKHSLTAFQAEVCASTYSPLIAKVCYD